MSWGTNVLVGQSGGPTAVINSSLAGVYEAAKALGAAHVYGMEYGIQGLLQGKIVDLDDRLDDKMEIELLKRTPSSYLGSCRFKLPNPATDERPFVQLFELFAKYCIGAVFYIGAMLRWTPLPSFPLTGLPRAARSALSACPRPLTTT